MADPTPTPTPRSGTKGVIPAEWPAQAADTIVDTIALVRDRTTKPILVAARATVYGLVAGIIGAVAFFLLLVMLVRIWDNYFPGEVWILYAIFFVVFSGLGLYALRKANRPIPTTEL